MKIKGVNLGNWLVLEKWMSPALFDGTTAEDEYYLPTQLSRDAYEARIKGGQSSLNGMDFGDAKDVSFEERTRIYNDLSRHKRPGLCWCACREKRREHVANRLPNKVYTVHC